MNLMEVLQHYADSGVCPMHMPGHKRRALYGGGLLPWQIDITEIDGFDNLHNAQGILKEGMERAAQLYGADRSFYLVNGSTCGILAGICTATVPGDTVILPRGCHKSVYHALELRDLTPVYLPVPTDHGFGIAGSLSPETVDRTLKAHPETRLLIVTSPTYEGVISDLQSIAALAHKAGVPVLVDEAHGAHLGFSSEFSGGAVKAGADIVIQSLHKTLPGLTQTALAHINRGLVDAGEFARQLTIFETSSPSYPMMASIDCCIQLLQEQGDILFAAYEQNLAAFDQAILKLKHLRVLCHGRDRLHAHPALFQFDPGKLVISTRGTQMNGWALSECLRKDYGIVPEMAMGDYVLAMTSICDTEETLTRLSDALCRIDRDLHAVPVEDLPETCPVPPQRMRMNLARRADGCGISLTEAVGRVCGEMVWAYPPGVPLIVPGEEVMEACIRALKKMSRQGVRLWGERGTPPETVWVVKNADV